MTLHRWFLVWAAVAMAALMLAAAQPRASAAWSAAELEQIRELSIASLERLAPDPSNRVADDERAAELGRHLFFDKRFSANGEVACATCHQPQLGFQDGTPLAKGVGTTSRRTMGIVGTAYSPWQFWDGRKDSQWAQALGPLESAVEHGGDRTQYAHLIAAHYAKDYEAIFGRLPALQSLPRHAGPVDDATAKAQWQAMTAAQREQVTTVFANMGKAIAAYERKLLPGASRFDAYAEAAQRSDAKAMAAAMTRDEAAGLKLFIGKANCVQCHSGPLFTNHEFHNTGVPAAAGLPPDIGRRTGAKQVLQDEFNCLSRYSDAKVQQCGEVRFLAEGDAQAGQFRVPSLRNVASRAPYMHAGQIATMRDVIRHYDAAPAAPQGHSELKPIGLSGAEVAQLAAFLGTLDGPVNAAGKWLREPR